jgi:hypothetical protein
MAALVGLADLSVVGDPWVADDFNNEGFNGEAGVALDLALDDLSVCWPCCQPRVRCGWIRV